MLLLTASCQKDDAVPLQAPSVRSVWGAKQYFWINYWEAGPQGYQLKLKPDGLTQQAIDKGIRVYVAMWSETTPFEPLPTVFSIPSQGVKIELFYTARPGELRIIAQSPSSIPYPSDVYIEFKLN